MGLVLSASDREMVRHLREDVKVLENVDDKNRLDIGNGIVHWGCPDLNQFSDIFRQYVKMFERWMLDTKVHPLGLNGGALIIPDECAANSDTMPQGRVSRHNILWAANRLCVQTVALFAHAPCKLAGELGLSVLDELDLLMRAKLAVLRSAEEERVAVKVACFFHVDKGMTADGMPNKRTYFVPRAKWEQHKSELRTRFASAQESHSNMMRQEET